MSNEKPCRACQDFKTWTKREKEAYDSKKKKQDQTPVTSNSTRDNCPLDKDELGSKSWAFLHSMAAYYPDKPNEKQKTEMKNFFHIFSKFYPCNICADDLQEQLKRTPPETGSQEKLSQWLCRIHNEPLQ
ncbi:FAD-linked sulfhydryl oxidase ALR isoform X2 [Formica exsecta]|uniref:FAD-linked sulfhydryl oxidase ALR isoform X2 n=1 Tax=Formica exsecta TaxID=72781 RepID=UPI0011415089|nr:FAD-linked sulfhydryl oxidase ALR isoform X2 [Formica exsecta]